MDRQAGASEAAAQIELQRSEIRELTKERDAISSEKTSLAEKLNAQAEQLASSEKSAEAARTAAKELEAKLADSKCASMKHRGLRATARPAPAGAMRRSSFNAPKFANWQKSATPCLKPRAATPRNSKRHRRRNPRNWICLPNHPMRTPRRRRIPRIPAHAPNSPRGSNALSTDERIPSPSQALLRFS